MTTLHTASSHAKATPVSRHWGGPVVGGFFISMGGVHVGLVAADTDIYRPFADAGLFAFVRDGWQDIFMASPVFFGLMLAAAETAMGIALQLGGRFATFGWAGVVVFHLLLMLFGFGIWSWCVPALAVLVVLARRDASSAWGARRLASRRSGDPS